MIDKLSVCWLVFAGICMAWMVIFAVGALSIERGTSMTLIYPVVLDSTQMRLAGMAVAIMWGIGAMYCVGEYLKELVLQPEAT